MNPPPPDVVTTHLRTWGEDLVDLTRRNRLLYFKHVRTASLAFVQEATAVVEGLDGRAGGGGWGFHLPPEPADGDAPTGGDAPTDGDAPIDGLEPTDRAAPTNGVVPIEAAPPRVDELIVDPAQGKDRAQIERGLKTLARTAQAEFLESGLWVLYLGLGFLHWQEAEQTVASPIYLLPVRLEARGSAKAWRLLPYDDGEPALNPSLAVKLESDFGITLPSLDDLNADSYQAAVDAVRAAVATTSWTVDHRAVLSTFTFHKEVIYRDLRQNADRIAQHPLVRLLAEGPTSSEAEGLAFEPEPEVTLDERHPPEELACVLDADATQRQCLVAARLGRSFVMDGPPGTGKSQTIANLIAQLLRDAKSVLFVSEKAAALEVVHNRLAAVGLDPFVLALHSHKTTRKAVAQELGAALDVAPLATSSFTEEDRARARRNRQELTDYAVAVNEVRQPSGWALHDVIGRLSQLEPAPLVSLTGVDLSSLDPSGYGQLLDQARALGRAWGPVEQSDRFLWRDLANPATPVADTEHRARIARLREATVDLQAAVARVGGDLRMPAQPTPAQAAHLDALLGLVETRPPVDPAWLSTDQRPTWDDWIEQLAQQLDWQTQAVEQLDAVTPNWPRLDGEVAARLVQQHRYVGDEGPPTGPPDTLGGADLSALSTGLAATAAAFASVTAAGAHLAATFGLSDQPLTLSLVRQLAALGLLAGSPARPPSRWLTASGLGAARHAVSALSRLVATEQAYQISLSGTFKPEALDADLVRLRARLAAEQGALKWLSGDYRADKAAVANLTHGGKATAEVLERLDDLVAWQQVSNERRQAEVELLPILAPGETSARGLDFERLQAAIEQAQRIVSTAGSIVAPKVVAATCGEEAPPDVALAAVARAGAGAMEAVPAAPVADWLGPAFTRLEDQPLAQVVPWFESMSHSIGALAADTAAIEALAGRPLALADARQLADHCCTLARQQTQTRTWIEQARTMLGPLADDPEALTAARLRAASQWGREVRAVAGDPVPSTVAVQLLSTSLTRSAIGPAREAFEAARGQLLSLFGPSQAEFLSHDIDHSFPDAVELLDALAASVSDGHEWWAHVEARTALEAAGLGSVVDEAVRLKVAADVVPDMVERALRCAWVEQIVGADSRLRRYRAADRDEIRAEFAHLDQAMVRAAAADVINACTERRPRTSLGGAGVIRQQAQLKTRHKAVRTLLSEAGEAAQLLKPCFMMSPLSVSQFLPPDIDFDVVIFDEASQVREADAICCVYRGRQLVVAGDQKQLPPTSFFDRLADGEDIDADADSNDEVPLDFESVLDRCKAQGFVALPLSWHYRSRHEHLIAFSNQSFYDGKLHTFPGADFEASDLGVGFVPVPDGVYRRGGTRDNPIEAAAVVDRVVFHCRHHPDDTLGVITLSSAQQSAVEAEIDRRAATEPELRQLVTDDRLSGFFVKNLESVQGDERDIVILSIGYGRDEVGKLTMNFGPMNRPGGERRLNVAVTRARKRVEVVSSITAGDIDTPNPTIRHLARYLDFAQRGPQALALDLAGSQGDAESWFEEEVIRSIRALGYDPVPQVGVAGYRIDVAIRHPSKPGSYLLGVECDGAAYHSAKVARDRDRLRQQVLEGLGWTIHRIWSTAWFTDRAAEEERLRRAIDNALSVTFNHESSGSALGPIDGMQPEIDDPVVELVERPVDAAPDWAEDYVEPVAPAPVHQLGTEFHHPAAGDAIAEQVVAVVGAQGPIHAEAVLRAVRAGWGLDRSTQRVRDAFDLCLDQLRRHGVVERHGDWLSLPGQSVVVRLPSGGRPGRPVGEVPPAEIELGITRLLEEAGSAGVAELRQAWARLYGWQRIGADINAAFAAAVDSLLQAGTVTGPDPLKLG